MSNLNFEQATYKIVQYIRSHIRENVHAAMQTKQCQAHEACWRALVPVLNGSIDAGYAAAYPEVLKTYELHPASETERFSVPDALIDAAADLVNLGRQGKRPFAAFTIVRNEPFFLDLWCSYYGRAFGEENLYVLDNSTDDGSVEAAQARFPRINVVPVPNDAAMRWGWCTNIVKHFQRICLRGYDVVTFSDADEYLVPEDGLGLRSYCERFAAGDQPYVRATGWGVVHQVDDEPALQDNADVLRHRSKAWRTTGYDKALVSRVPIDWSKGCHSQYVNGVKRNDPSDKSLSLVHLRDVDVGVFHQHCVTYDRLNPHKLLASFHGSTDVEQVREYMRTRRPPWNPESLSEYQPEMRAVSDVWRDALRRVGT